MSEIKDIPKHWQVKKLGEVCDKISLNGIKIKQKDYLAVGNYPVVDQGQELIGGYYNDKNLVVPAEPPYIIFGDHTKVKKYINFKFIAGADGVKVLKPHNIYDPKFFFFLIHTVNIPDKGYARHFQFLEKEEIPLPPLPEQVAIVAKIEELLSDLENGKQQLLTAQQQLIVYRQSLLKAAFEGKLTRLNYDSCENSLNYDSSDLYDKNDEEKMSKKNHGNQNQSNHNNQTNHSSDNLPKGWKWVKVGDVIEKPQYGTSKKCDYNNEGIGVLRIPNISNGSVDSKDLKFAKFERVEIESYCLKEGDILTIRSNGSVDLVGKCALIKEKDEKYLYAGYLIKLRSKQELILPKYLLNVLSSSFLRNQIEGKAKSTSGVNNINSEELKSLIIPICPLEEQQLIVAELESKLTVCDKLEETINDALQKSETLRQSILKKAFSGQLVKNHVNPQIT